MMKSVFHVFLVFFQLYITCNLNPEWYLLEVMAESLGAFMEDPSNMDALMPFLEQVEEVGMNMDIMQTNMLKSMGYDNTEELMQDVRKQ